MLNFNNIRADDGFYKTTSDTFLGTNLNDLPDELILDIADEKFPKCRFSKDFKFLVVLLSHEFDVQQVQYSIHIEVLIRAIQNYIFTLRQKGFFVYDNEIWYNGNNISIDWSFQRKLPVDTESLFIEIQEVYKIIEAKAKEIIELQKN